MAEMVSFYFQQQAQYDIAAYVCSDEHHVSDAYLNKPLYRQSQLLNYCPPDTHSAFIAIGFSKLNRDRREKFDWFIENKYDLANLILTPYRNNADIGKNCIIDESVVIKPFVKIGDNVTIGCSLIDHHAVIRDDVFIAGNCSVGACSDIGRGSFMGLGSIVCPRSNIGEYCILGAGALAMGKVYDKSVLLDKASSIQRFDSDQFIKISKIF